MVYRAVIQPHAKVFSNILVGDIDAEDSATAIFTETSELPTHLLEPNDESDGVGSNARTYLQLSEIQNEAGLRALDLPNPRFNHQNTFHRNAEFFYKRGRVDGDGIVVNGTITFTETAQNEAAEARFFNQVDLSRTRAEDAREAFRNGSQECVFNFNSNGAGVAFAGEHNFPDITPASRVFLQKRWLDEVRARQTTGANNRLSRADESLPLDFGRRRVSIPEPIAPILASGTFSADELNDNVIDRDGRALNHFDISTGRYGLTFGSDFSVNVPNSSRQRISTYRLADERSRLSGDDNSTLYRVSAREFGGPNSAEPAVGRIYDHLPNVDLDDENDLASVRRVVNRNTGSNGEVTIPAIVDLATTSTGGGANGGGVPDINGTPNADRPLRGTDDGENINGLGGGDLIIGQGGADVLTGGPGNDRFRLDSLSDTGDTVGAADQITDFQRGSDRIDIRRIDANTNVGANQNFTVSDSREVATIRLRPTANGGTVVEGHVDDDRDADFIIVVSGVTGLNASDFVL